MTMHTSSRSASASVGAPWTVRATIERSTPTTLLGALVVAIIALTCTLDARVPLTTGVVLVALLPAMLVDLIERRLPNRLVAAAALVGVTTLVAEVVVSDLSVAPADLLLGALGMAGPLLLAHVVSPAAMGFGDVKVGVVTGSAVGLVDPILGLAALAIGSAATALVGVMRRRRTLAFGPGLLGGAIIAVVLVASPLGPLDHDDVRVVGPTSVTSPDDTPSHSEGDLP